MSEPIRALLPCPFCGHANAPDVMTSESLGYSGGEDGFFVVCRYRPSNQFGCGAAAGWHATIKEAVTAWNRRALSAPEPEGWRDIESAPKNGRTLLLGKFNSHGKWRTMRGQWFSRETIEADWEQDDADEGWYETCVESDELPNCWWTEPTHWQPLPKPPAAPPTDKE